MASPALTTFAQRIIALALERICELRLKESRGDFSNEQELRHLEMIAGDEAPQRSAACGTCPGCAGRALDAPRQLH